MRGVSLGYVTGTFQHIGSRFTQVGDDELGSQSLLTFEANTIGAPLTASTVTFFAKLPSYDLLNLRVGIRKSAWDVSAYVNNVTDERALLALDRERGLRARIGYLTNQPRTFGISSRFNF
jgi:iron complex outermembrane receptor protein